MISRTKDKAKYYLNPPDGWISGFPSGSINKFELFDIGMPMALSDAKTGELMSECNGEFSATRHSSKSVSAAK